MTDYDDLCKRLRMTPGFTWEREAADAIAALREQVAAKDAEIRDLSKQKNLMNEIVRTAKSMRKRLEISNLPQNQYGMAEFDAALLAGKGGT